MTQNQRKAIENHRTRYIIDFKTVKDDTSEIIKYLSGLQRWPVLIMCWDKSVFLALLLVACQWEIKDPPVNPSGSLIELMNNLQVLEMLQYVHNHLKQLSYKC